MTKTCAGARLARRGGLIGLASLATLVVLVSAAPAASASPNNSPSTAVPVEIGVPFTGNWLGTSHLHGTSSGYYHWWQLPSPLRPGDQVHIAVDNRQS